MTGIAVSGGADSIYLLHHFLEHGAPVLVLHVNHKLRGGESDADERFVQHLTSSLGLPFKVHTAAPATGNQEQEARSARYDWFRSLIREGAVDCVALGHTRSDQAETVLFRFLRGSGTAGLAAIRPETADGFVRPLLRLTRDEIRDSLRSRAIGWREDSSNTSRQFARNRIRHDLLPLLQREWNPRIETALAQTAEWALGEEQYWAEELARLATQYFRTDGDGLIVRWPSVLPVAVQRRLIRHAIELVKGDLRQIEFRHVESILKLRTGRTHLPDLIAERSFSELRLTPPHGEAGAFSQSINPPETAHNLEFRVEPAEGVYNYGRHQLDWVSIAGPLKLRNWHPGDRYRRAGHTLETSLKILFQKARVPIWERRSWPVLMNRDRIAWSRTFGAAADFACTDRTGLVLRITDLSNRNL